MENKVIAFRQIEQAMEQAGVRFTIAQLAEKLNKKGDSDLLRRLQRTVEADDRYFIDGAGNCVTRNAFFEELKFAVTPDSWEIKEGILFPPNRLTPFLTEEVFPSDAVLKFRGAELPKKEIHLPLGEAIRYCLLLGSEQIPDYLEADSRANTKLRQKGTPSTLVTMTVFDLALLYRELHFEEGDALIFQLTDRENGVFAVDYRSGSDRSGAARKTFATAFEQALEKVEEKFRNYLEIPDQISWAFFFGGSSLSGAEASVEEVMTLSSRIQIRTNGDHAVLALLKPEEEDATQAEEDEEKKSVLPDGLSLSSGETSDVSLMLREIGTTLTPVELDGFILDNCATRDLDFDRLFARAFPHGDLKFADEAQETIFRNYVEERFEELSSHYNRVDDEPKAPLRASIMELVEDRLNFLADAEEEAEKDDKRQWKRLSEIFIHLNEILKQLNAEGYQPSDAELDRLQAMIESHTDELDTLMGEEE